MFFAVAIDGPSGAGKSTIAKAVAEKMGFIYVDTGAIYRTVALAVLMSGKDCSQADQISEVLPGLSVELNYDSNGKQRMFLNGQDVTEQIRYPQISSCASKVSAVPAVRSFLLDKQRSIASSHNVIMDGRDIGTVVLPDAQLKVFLTAEPETRAHRRLKQQAAKGITEEFEKVLKDINERDERDTHREIAPLKPAADSIFLDTSNMTLPESIDRLCEMIRSRMC